MSTSIITKGLTFVPANGIAFTNGKTITTQFNKATKEINTVALGRTFTVDGKLYSRHPDTLQLDDDEFKATERTLNLMYIMLESASIVITILLFFALMPAGNDISIYLVWGATITFILVIFGIVIARLRYTGKMVNTFIFQYASLLCASICLVVSLVVQVIDLVNM